MNLVETFKKEKIAINCETEQEAEKFIDWCYNNGMEFIYNGKKTYYYKYSKKLLTLIIIVEIILWNILIMNFIMNEDIK